MPFPPAALALCAMPYTVDLIDDDHLRREVAYLNCKISTAPAQH